MDDYPMLTKLESACSDLKTLLNSSGNLQTDLTKLGENYGSLQESLNVASRRLAPLQSLSIASKALETRINRAVSPALVLIDGFRISESLQRKLVDISSKLSVTKSEYRRLRLLIKYVDCVDKLNIAINLISQEGGPAILRLQEVVEFLSRTKATDQFRAHRLRETLVTLNALYETEVDSMKFDGLLDEALLNLQDEFEGILQQLKHHDIVVKVEDGGDDGGVAAEGSELGTEMEVEALRRISETLTANDCLDICIDIFVKVRYKRAAKALMRLNPDYLRTYKPEEIDEMEWESLETSISLWIQHFELAVQTVFVSEKNLCNQVLGNIMEGIIWQECFVKIADKIMAVFFRFGEGVARSNKEPQKLFKLLDMFNSLENLKTEVSDIFEGEAGADICSRFRELEKLLIHASTKVYWEFGLQIEGNQDGLPPPQDGSVPKLVRYAINYLKYLTTSNYNGPMTQVLKTEQIWKNGILSVPETDESLLKDAISNVMEALHRNIESKRSGYKDKVLYHVFTMNTYWYIYMRTRNTEVGKLLGENYMRKNYKVVAEEAAYLYEKQAWGGLVRLLDKEDIDGTEEGGIGVAAKGKIEAFLKGFEEIAQRHKSKYSIPEDDLREQIKEATIKLIVPVYREFLDEFSKVLSVKAYSSPESIEGLLSQIFSRTGRNSSLGSRQREIKEQSEGRNSVSSDTDQMPGRTSVSSRFQRNRSSTSDV
ncbi:exocyst complex protein Exo70, Cullin repeat-like-containing domain protein [Artemisia annua]|uniref:Exocyst subunit Exo70 family protein n=1 Tax=Artemisia annua TaxID=35608 RepID=A0A2U1KRB6_ARTAN|nr:exocyst complex protein Exo70, Cullin repeat-like-containing domain protein [Artemisia annua]